MTEKTIQTWRDPYGMGFSTCRPKQIRIKSGLTILVGCNGAGKTTMLHNIADKLKKEGIPRYFYDNLSSGGKRGIQDAIDSNNIDMVAAIASASEGETINLNVGEILKRFQEFMETGRVTSRQTRLSDLFSEYKTPETKERWLLFDALDSGHSIDNVIDVKEIYKQMIQKAEEAGYTLYIIAAANEYELACNTPCMDVTNGKYLTFHTYDDYKKFILQSRKKKDKRYETLAKKRAAQPV